MAKNVKKIGGFGHERINFAVAIILLLTSLANIPSAMATTKGLSQIVTPDLQPEGDLSLSLQIQDKRIANPYELQAELGLTKWGEVAVFRGFQPDDWIFATEIGLLTKEPSSFRWVRELVPSPERRSSALYRSWLLHRASQSVRRRHACRLQKRSNSRLCVRLQ